MRNRNILLTLLLIIGSVTLISAVLPSQPRFINLKILPKNISEKELNDIMDSYNSGLGVKCDFCHAKKSGIDELDFAPDAKAEKEISRKMMTMTNDINKRYFDFNKAKNNIQAVTCYTCHHGEPRPLKETPLPDGN